MSLFDSMFSPGQVGGKDWRSSSFSGGVFLQKRASPNEWQIWMASSPREVRENLAARSQGEDIFQAWK
ncbi:unnamed protein product [Lupinus luteus]|uniref:Uncharacterized protein n=1 Tax=Lupinus luteus TaxID=3873 RepID=A0AAV1XM06_LUPLU